MCRTSDLAPTALILLLASFAAQAHDIRLPIATGADGQLSLFGPGSPRSGYRFDFSGQQAILLGPDPTLVRTAVLVYGTGANGGSTGRLDLDARLWTATPTGFQYSDPSGASGISSITLEQGALHVVGADATWPWTPTGQIRELWFHFLIEDEWFCAEADILTAFQVVNRNNAVSFTDTTAPFSCPDQVCGNGIREPGEVCDDGNLVEGDGCSNDCQSDACDAIEFDSTFEGIQSVIFDSPTYGCSNLLCHSPISISSPLDLTAGTSYDQLVNVPSFSPTVDGVTILDRVEPGEPIASFLYEKLAAKTNGTPTGGISAMPPLLAPALVPEHLEAIEKWIRAGAPRDLVVAGTAPLLGTCLPPEDPLKFDPPEYPPVGEGVQFRSSAWMMPAHSEDELCYATYYDLTQTNLVPPEHQLECPEFFNGVNNPSGKCFYYNRRILRQDAQSHHSIIHIYTGSEPLGDPSGGPFGPFTTKPNYPEPGPLPEHCDPTIINPVTGLNDECDCDPTIINPLTGQSDECSGVIVSGVACTGWGPTDFAQNSPQFAGSQEPYAENEFHEGVFSILPMAGIIGWNSHAFNLSGSDTTMATYLDIYFGEPDSRQYFVQGVFDIGKIFIHEVPPFETREYCKTHTIGGSTPVVEDINIFELTSHTHRHGVEFRIWGPPNEPCDPGGTLQFSCEPNCACEPRDPSEDPSQLLYFSKQYTDPVQLEFDPPLRPGSTIPERTFLFCSLYDNGSTPDSPPVKRQSTSPSPPPFAQGGFEIKLGGPCPDVDSPYPMDSGPATGFLGTIEGVKCMDGPNQGKRCGAFQNPQIFCETEPGLNDGECDACSVMGGFTTEDEMFILIGSYFVPEPSSVMLAVAALATLGLLARRRRRR